MFKRSIDDLILNTVMDYWKPKKKDAYIIFKLMRVFYTGNCMRIFCYLSSQKPLWITPGEDRNAH